ncbi:hypothetical protein GDO86_003258 [Hymenochirus boettgeri]|uniref:Vomeronasal type-1 receptor n=1 Tax=Hymenochirus boettgeri TaxID=247094 RepID=A0A8T2K524_9PIPI|nr:hypothetical protein GDO86_003258 [Hymenochirus boettgeri]
MAINFLLEAFVFNSLVIIGIPANIFIFLRLAHISVLEKRFLPSNIIRISLSFANLIILVSRVLPQALYFIGVRNLFDDKQCKLVIYFYRVSRAMSICITSYLSCYQCILIAPVNAKSKPLKQILNCNVALMIALFLVMNMLVYSARIFYVKATSNDTLSPYTLRLVYCDIDFLNYPSYTINGLVSAIRDIIFVGLMIISSTYMLYVLYCHGQSMKGMRSSDRGQQKTAEYKASRVVILLVAMYLALFGMDNSMWIYTLTMSNVEQRVNDTRLFLSASYAALCPIHTFIFSPKLHSWFKNPWRKQIITFQVSFVTNDTSLST